MENETSLVLLLPKLLVPSQDLMSFLQSCLPLQIHSIYQEKVTSSCPDRSFTLQGSICC